VPCVNVLVHGPEVHDGVVLRTCRRGNGDLEVVSGGMLRGVVVEGLATGLEEEHKVLRLGRVGRVFPVNVETIKAPVLDELDGRRCEALASSLGGGDGGELGRVGPPTDGEENLQVAVLLFEEVQLLDAAVNVVPNVIPRVRGVVLLDIRPGIRPSAVSGCQIFEL